MVRIGTGIGGEILVDGLDKLYVTREHGCDIWNPRNILDDRGVLYFKSFIDRMKRNRDPDARTFDSTLSIKY
jgi:hypothetical protein